MILFCVALLLGTACAQDAAVPNLAIPNLVKFSGIISATPGATVGVIFALYQQQAGGAPLWQEVQTVTTDTGGHYAALLGTHSPKGIPLDVFSGGDARWLGVQPQGQPEQPRVLLASVPYAFKAADAETLGGLPASAYLRADPSACGRSGVDCRVPVTDPNSALLSAGTVPTAAPLSVTGAMPGVLPIFTDTAGDLGASAFFQLNAGTVANPVWNLGLGTTTPAFNLNFVSTVDPAAVAVDGYGIVGINFIGRRARGTPSVPTAIQAGDNIMAMQGRGYGTTGFSPYSRASMKFWAAENWTDSAQGTYISLTTTRAGTIAATERFRITDAGLVGIGTTTPASPLTVNGPIQSLSGGFVFPDGTIQTTAPAIGVLSVAAADSSIAVAGTASAPTLAVATGGITDAKVHDVGVAKVTGAASTLASNLFVLPQTINVGTTSNVALTLEADSNASPNALYATTGSLSGTANAIYAVASNASSSASAIFGQTFGSGVPIYASANNATVAVTAVEGDVASSAGIGLQGFAFAQSGNTEGVVGKIRSPSGVAILGSGIAQTCVTTGASPTCTPIAGGTGGEFQTFAGGTLLVGQAVDVNFNPTNVFRVDSTGKGFFDGGTQLSGADFAESVDVEGDRADYSPGDLLTVGLTRDRQFSLVAQPYSTLVAGIYATRPGILATPHLMSDPRIAAEVPLTVVGIVPCKVTAENGSIQRGDLLVSSSTPGRAMKGTDRTRMLGAVVGKALGSLDHGTGVIDVLVTLQ
jgi:hypothetical protein